MSLKARAWDASWKKLAGIAYPRPQNFTEFPHFESTLSRWPRTSPDCFRIVGLLRIHVLESGWWLTYPSEKYEFVSWDYYSIPNRFNRWKYIKIMFPSPPTHTNQLIWLFAIHVLVPNVLLLRQHVGKALHPILLLLKLPFFLIQILGTMNVDPCPRESMAFPHSEVSFTYRVLP